MRTTLLATVLVAGALSAQSPLTTTFAGGNGLSASGSTQYFDLNVKVGVAVTQFDCNIWTGGTATTINVYSIPGTHVGNEASSAGWTMIGTATNAAPAANGTPSSFVFGSAIPLAPGAYGIAVEYVGDGMAYTNGTAVGNVFASNSEIDFLEGGSANTLFTGLNFSPRVWNGSIYYSALAGFATATPYGSGCGGVANYATFYEQFAPGGFDLGGAPGAETVLQALNSGTGYAVLPGAPAWFTPVAADLALGDDTISTPQPLGFTMTLPGGFMTTDVVIGSNGYVYLDPTGSSTSLTGSGAALTSDVSRIAMCWMDLQPLAGGGSGTIHFDSDPANGAAYVTFLGVQQFGTGNVGVTIDMQLALFSNGNFELRYGNSTIATGTDDPVVGYTPGNGALVPPQSDLSNLPIFTQPDLLIADLALSSDRPVEGSMMNININNIPAGTALGTLILSGTQVNPGIQPLPGLGNCFQYVGLDDVFYYFPTGSSHVLTFPVPATGFTGSVVYAQAVTLSPGINPVGVASSNGVEWLIDAN